jgi:hypothetical protein
MPTAEQHFQRLELVRSLHYRGKSITEIINVLEAEGLLNTAVTCSSKYRSVQRCLAKVKKGDLKKFRATQEEHDTALIEYIARQSYLFQRAIEDRQWECARSLSRDLAKAHGVVVDEPVRVEADLLTLLRAATEANRQRRLEGISQAVGALPGPIEAEVVNPKNFPTVALAKIKKG